MCRFAALVLCASLLAMSGCALRRTGPHAPVGAPALQLEVQVAPDANSDSPVAVDVVVIRSKQAFTLISALTAQDWFRQKHDLQRQLGKQIAISCWEWVPGQVVAKIPAVPEISHAAGVLLFANYSGPGEHRASLPARGTVQVFLGKTDFSLRTAWP